jgi:V-type H+-transporting ATPase subunit a
VSWKRLLPSSDDRSSFGRSFKREFYLPTPCFHLPKILSTSQGDNVYKSVFIIFFQGDQLKTRVKKICEGFRATLYPCPEAPADRREMAMGVMTRIEDLNTVLGQTQDHRHRVLVAAAKNLKNWFVKVRKIKAIYHTLNLFNLDVTQKCLIAECWVPVLDIETIQMALRRGTVSSLDFHSILELH